MEEDTGKLIHENIKGENVSLIDFNRSGVPLVEIVTDPDFTTADEVVEYLKKLQQIVRYLSVSNADMEKGDMRLEPNISLKLPSQQGFPPYKVEVKNINSFKFVEKAINYEISRQTEILDEGKIPAQETRGWNEKKQATLSQRSKEEANDYRYFPEPDIPPLRFKQEYINKLKDELPELPKGKQARFIKDYVITDYDSEILTREKEMADYFEEAVIAGKIAKITPKQIANEIINKKVDIEKILPAELIKQIISRSQFAQIDNNELEDAIKKVMVEQEKAVNDYKNGKTEVLGFLLGMVRRKLGKPTDPAIIKKSLEGALK
jgi:aspartyl-tRNA(Asn)/glutamyl-tRNA(Gln) amidotransferase subunit B